MHQIAVRVAQQLHLHMTRAAHQLLEIHLIIAKGGCGFAARDFQLRGQLVLGLNHPHTPATAAPAGLEHQRIADCASHLSDLIHVLWQSWRGRHHRHIGSHCRIARRHLIPQRAHDLGRRADEDDPVAGASLGKIGIFGQKTITGMNRIDLCFSGDANDVLDIEVGRDRLFAFADQITFVRFESM